MSRVPVPGLEEIDIFQIIMDTKRDGLQKKYEGHSIEEAAAFNDVTLLYTEMENSRTGLSKNKDGKHCIVLSPSLRKEEKTRMFYTWLAVALVEREKQLDVDEEA